MIDGLLEIFESITRHRLRTAATAFGVFWGIFMVTLLLAGGTGLRNGLNRIFESDAVNSVWIEGDRTSQVFERLGAGRQIVLNIEDVEALIEGVDELENVSPRQPLPNGITLTRGTKNVGVPVFGIFPGYSQAEKTVLTRGRLINELDLQRARKVIVLGERASELLFGRENPVGDSVDIGGTAFQVVGVFTDAGGERETRRAIIPYTALSGTFDPSGKTQFIVATLKDGVSPARARAHARRVLARKHRFSPEDAQALGLWFTEEEYRKVMMLMRGIDLAIFVVGLGTLISGMVGVSNILFVSVRERAAEFGLRRALGATPASVLRMVLAEAVLLALLAGGVGLGIGLSLVQFAQKADIKSDFFEHPNVDTRTALFALGVLVLTSLLAGYFPAREAARANPIDALRRE
jgi:putative ABC transport system permease protein